VTGTLTGKQISVNFIAPMLAPVPPSWHKYGNICLPGIQTEIILNNSGKKIVTG